MENNVKVLINEVRENLKGYDRENAISNLIELCNITANEEMVYDIIHSDDIDDFIKARLDNGNWQGVACCLAQIEYLNDEYYLINGYGNLEEINISYLESLLNDIIRNI